MVNLRKRVKHTISFEERLAEEAKNFREAADSDEGYLAAIEKLRREAAETALIRDLAPHKDKRETFHRLHEHFNRLADEVEQA
jgi:hypothetical protein